MPVADASRRKTYPSALPEGVQAKLVSDLSGVHGVGQILLVGEDQEKSITELVLVEHALELLTGLDDTVAIVGVDDEDDTLGVLEVMSPERTDLVLSTDIPHGELNVLVLDGLDVETCSEVESSAPSSFRFARVVQIDKPGCVRGCYEPIVGMVVTISPSFRLYRMVVLPAASRPTIRILISFLPHRRSNSLEKVRPMLAVGCDVRLGGVCVEGGRKGPSRVSCAARKARSAHVLRVACARFARAPLIEGREVNTPA